MSLDDLERMWGQHTSATFPRGLDVDEIDGVCLRTTDTYIAGCVSVVLKRKALDPERLNILTRCCSELERVLPQVKNPFNAYFSRLLKIGQQALGRARST